MDSQNIQWFPGHMAKTRRKIAEVLPQVDTVAELVDARVPLASRNPEMDQLTKGKPRLMILNKADLADPSATEKWIALFQKQGFAAVPVDSKTGQNLTAALTAAMRSVLADKIAAWEAKGMVGRPIRAMVAGIPNVGKSSLINRLAGTTRAKTEDRPGVTRSNQWFNAGNGVQLLDTPGVLWPKFEDQEAARLLAYTGAIRDEILDIEELACGLLVLLARDYPNTLCERYKLTAAQLEECASNGWGLLQLIGRKRSMVVSGGETDTGRAAVTVLDEFRGGKIDRITLELPH